MSGSAAGRASRRDIEAVEDCFCDGKPNAPQGVCTPWCNSAFFWVLLVFAAILVGIVSIGLYTCSESEQCDIGKYLFWVWIVALAVLMFVTCIMCFTGTAARRWCKRCCCLRCIFPSDETDHHHARFEDERMSEVASAFGGDGGEGATEKAARRVVDVSKLADVDLPAQHQQQQQLQVFTINE